MTAEAQAGWTARDPGLPVRALDGDRSESNLETLAAIERRVLWLATRIVDFANRERASSDALKVGGHQASSASMVTLMTALYFQALRGEDRVSVKPHASPVLHAIEYLLGRLPQGYLTTLRDFGGLQAYPSRTKDPFPVDFSTGSVGLGAAAPLFAALAGRYADSHFNPNPPGRFISLLGDAELDEGNVWEAVFEPHVRELTNVLWIVDLNRQSLDRIAPTIRAHDLERQFEAAGWSVIELKYGRALREVFARPNGRLLQDALDAMPNQVYQGLFGADDAAVAAALAESVDPDVRGDLVRLLANVGGGYAKLVQSLGGHDLADVLDAIELAGTQDAPAVIFAYTIKGYGLPIAGHASNHSALLTGEQIGELRTELGLTVDDEWDVFPPESRAGALCRAAAERLARADHDTVRIVDVPVSLPSRDVPRSSTQEAFGRALLELSRVPGLAERIVTASPDVSVSTNLGGWINKMGVFGPAGSGSATPDDSPLKWNVSEAGQHIELGISEMNLFLLLGQLGLTATYRQERLLPIGTLYDPFVLRGLEGLLYSVYNDARFLVAGTPSGVSLSREGGAHQSTITPGVGIELPGLVYAEPCFARELEWQLLESLRHLQAADGESTYLRLSTKPIDQSPFIDLIGRRGEDAVRSDVLAGGYLLRGSAELEHQIVIVTCGAMVPEVLEAADLLESDEGVGAAVVVASSPDVLYREWRRIRLRPLRESVAPQGTSQLERLVQSSRPAGLVTVIDGASHSLAFIGACLGIPTVPLGVDRFGQTGALADVYEEYEISPAAIVTAALIALEGA